MKDLIEKLTSYNLFNYLLPGAMFSILADRFTMYSFVYTDLFVGFFAYYFTGLVISRVGSLALEPLLLKIRFVTFVSYEDYVRCSREDSKLGELSEANNTYRTLISVFISLGVLKIAEFIFDNPKVPDWASGLSLCLFLIILFLLSYRKQTAYIRNRINTR